MEFMTAVFVVKTTPSYPEFPYPITGSDLPSALRSLFALWGKDPSNPFADLASPGSCVLIKPNWVLDHNSSGYNIDSLITHSALIKYLIDFLIIALKGQGRIIIGDAPIQGCNFNNLIGLSRIKDVIEDVRRRHPEIEVNIEDWRLTVFDRPPGKITWLKTGEQRSITRAANSIPKTHFIVDLGKDSFLEEISEYCNRFRVAMYNPNLMVDHHKPGTHEYVVTNRIFEANLIINLPKMKTHHKAGLTGALKNIVGINGHKEYLPHHIKGSYFEGGDNYCIPNRLEKLRWFLENSSPNVFVVSNGSLEASQDL
jgi:uncharacterized protein (DUF362 family)